MVQKEKCDCQGLMLVALVVGVVIGLIAGMAIYASAYPVFQSDKWAAWVQAFGSIAAILGTFAIARSQLKESDRQRKKDRIEREAEVCEMAHGRARILLGCANDMLSGRTPRSSSYYKLESCIRLFDIASQQSLMPHGRLNVDNLLIQSLELQALANSDCMSRSNKQSELEFSLLYYAYINKAISDVERLLEDNRAWRERIDSQAKKLGLTLPKNIYAEGKAKLTLNAKHLD